MSKRTLDARLSFCENWSDYSDESVRIISSANAQLYLAPVYLASEKSSLHTTLDNCLEKEPLKNYVLEQAIS